MIPILYVDDEPALLEVTKIHLEKDSDYQVDTAVSAKVALDMMHGKSYDALVSDYQMPEMNGIELLKVVRSSGNAIPFIVFTGKGREEVALEALNNGADFYLQKGGDPRAQFGELKHKILQAVKRRQAEAALIEKNRVLTTLLDNIPGFLYRCGNDRNRTMKYVSEGCFELTGYHPDDLTENKKTAFGDLIEPHHSKRLFEKWQQVLADHDIFMDEYTIRTADGKIRWVWEKGRGVWDDSGRLLFLEGFITEITDRKHAESALRESEERYRTLVEHIQDGIFIIQNGVITYANPPLAQIAGYTADEITGKNFENMIAPQDRKMVLERYKARLDGREVPDTYDFHILHRDGKTEILVNMHVGIIHTGPGLAIIGTVRNITEQKKAELLLKAEEQQFRTLTESAPDMIYSVGLDGRLLYANSLCASMFRCRPEDLIGKTQEELFPPDLAQRHVDGIRNIVETGKPHNFEEHLQTPAGDFWISVKSVPVKNSEGAVVSILGIARDISDGKHLEEALQLANRKLAILSSATRHDINNKLTILSGYSQLIHADCADPKIIKYVTLEERAIADISKILKFTKEYEKMGINKPEWQAISETVVKALTDIELGPVTLTNEVSGCAIYADPMLERVFYNLCDNTIRYGETTTAIRIWHEQRGEDLFVIFEDNGKGIVPAQKERIFERGFGKNTGLGLFISREILAITGLEIRETGEYGKGARFEIRVPKGKYQLTKPA